MADPTIAEAISLLTKVSADTAQRLKSLEKEVRSSISGKGNGRSKGSTEPREPRQIVEAPKDVVVTNFGPEAEADLAAAFGRETEVALEKQQKKNNNDLTAILGLLGIGASLKALMDGEGIVGLVQGLQKVYRRIDKFASKAGKVLSRLGNRIASFAKSVGKRASSLLRRAGKAVSKAVSSMGKMARQMVRQVGNKLKRVASGIKKGIGKSISKVKGIVKTISTKFGGAFSSITSKIGSWGASLMKGMAAAKNKVAELAKKVTGSSSTPKPKPSPPMKQAGFWNKAGQLVKKTVGKATKAVGGAVKSGAQAAAKAGAAVGGAAKNVAGKALKFTKDTVLKPLGAAMNKVKPLKLVRGLLKSPLLAPILESFFTYKDIEELVAQEAAGDITEAELNQKVGTRLIKAVTGVVGGAGGAMLGGTIGSAVPIAGNIVGAIAGGVLGDIGGRLIGGLIADKLGDKTSILGERALKSKMFNHLGQPVIGEPLAQIDDGIIFSKDGRALAQANPSDTIYAMKEGGPLLTTLATGFESNGKLLANLHEMHADHMETQIELDEERNSLLLELGKLLYSSLNPTDQAAVASAGSMQFAGMSVADSRSFPTAPV